MFSGLLSKLTARHYANLATQGGLVCPQCAEPCFTPPEAGAEMMPCGACGTMAALTDWRFAGEKAKFIGRADHPPPGTEIVRGCEEGVATWCIPASGGGMSLLVFGAFWVAFTTLVSLPFLFAISAAAMGKAHGTSDLPAWGLWLILGAMVLFFGLFWAIGLGIFYCGLRARYARYVLSMDGTKLALRMELLGRDRTREMPLDDISLIAQKQFYRRDSTRVYGIEIAGRRRRIRFGTALAQAEKAWLVADLRRELGLRNGNLPGDGGTGVPLSAPASAVPPAVGGRQAFFSLSVRSAWGNSLPFASVAIAMGLAFIWIGWRFMNIGALGGDGSGPGVLRLVDGFFTIVGYLFKGFWLIFWTGMVCLGLWLVARYFLHRHEEVRLEGSSGEVAIRVMKHGRVRREKSFPRMEVTGVSSFVTGATGSRVEKQLMLLLGGRSERIAVCVDAAVAGEFERQANAALGVE